MRGVKIHAALLVVALLLASLTWIRERPSNLDRQWTVVWDRDTVDVRAVSYRSEGRDIDIERHAEGDEAFLWGVEVVRRPGSEGGDTLTFPVGLLGRRLLAEISALRVVRELGPMEPGREGEFGLAEPRARITIDFSDGARVLEVGDPVFRGSDHYVLDASTGIGYVLPAELVGPFQTGSGAIRERQVHYFQADDVARVRVRGSGAELVFERSAGDGRVPASWHRPEARDQSDLTVANFMERVSQLAIAGFDRQVTPETLESLVRIEYFGHDGGSLGFLDLFRDPGAATAEYFLMSERTRIPAGAIGLLAERVEQGLSEIF